MAQPIYLYMNVYNMENMESMNVCKCKIQTHKWILGNGVYGLYVCAATDMHENIHRIKYEWIKSMHILSDTGLSRANIL